MKRSHLRRKTPLNQGTGLQRKTSPQRHHAGPEAGSGGLTRGSLRAKPQKRPFEPGREAWKTPTRGHCEGCGKPGLMQRHHVVKEQHVRRPPTGGPAGDPWDMRNAMLLGFEHVCDCHERHTNKSKLIPLSKVSPATVSFARDLLGDYAEDYLRREYAVRDSSTNRRTG